MRREPGSGSSNPDPSKIHQTAKCEYFRIQTWSGSANCTKSNANASRFGFPNPDSRILCGPQIRIGSVPYGTDPLLRIQSGCNSLMCKGT